MMVPITALGMISSVGWDVDTSCASIRAGLTRTKELEFFSAYDSDEEDLKPVIGHPIEGIREGFFLIGLWIRLAHKCVLNLLQNGRLPGFGDAHFWEKTGFIAVTSSAVSGRFLSDEEDEPGEPSQIRDAFIVPLFKLLRLPVAERWRDICCEGHAGTAHASEKAMGWLKGTSLDRVIILAVDSYLDPDTLQWLQINNRLKVSEQPKGLMPGEAAACYMIETEASCFGRRQVPLAYLVHSATGFESHHLGSGEHSQGEALALVWKEVLQSISKPYTGQIFVDINGEEWRAIAYGFAQVRLGEMLDEGVTYATPAESLGETGAATGAVCVCMAIKSFLRGYASSLDAVILLHSEDGEVGALHLCSAQVRNNNQFLGGTQ